MGCEPTVTAARSGCNGITTLKPGSMLVGSQFFFTWIDGGDVGVHTTCQSSPVASRASSMFGSQAKDMRVVPSAPVSSSSDRRPSKKSQPSDADALSVDGGSPESGVTCTERRSAGSNGASFAFGVVVAQKTSRTT